jgi:hypothetical protein
VVDGKPPLSGDRPDGKNGTAKTLLSALRNGLYCTSEEQMTRPIHTKGPRVQGKVGSDCLRRNDGQIGKNQEKETIVLDSVRFTTY